ncbi:MAG TPA: hypothetical protein PLX62_07795 [Bacteroidales bacterium]|nr:hypothetical protein [Bacteroidales bacterium]MZQ79491.1 hypothetical protein [Bacteroidales bacterium]HHV00563.1 hypothetical protein [Bacteroidales bacterium]HNV67598.1 hypothetical protein [Bacteroidales bacterium]HNY58503.1 hypothetical protein [Bacteroidales bacterium]
MSGDSDQAIDSGFGNTLPQSLSLQLQALATSLQGNIRVVVPGGSDLVNVIGRMAGVAPLQGKK